MCLKKCIALLTFLGVAYCQDQGAVAGLSNSIRCIFGRQSEAPFWLINETIYELFSIPSNLPFIPTINSYSDLEIPYVYLSLNNTIFQCGTFRGDELELGPVIRLIVALNPNGGGDGDFGDAVISELDIDYQRLFILQDRTTFMLTANETCSTFFQVQGYTLPSSGPVVSENHLFNASNSNTVTIPSDQYTSNGTDIDYRLAAFTDDGEQCLENIVNYYRFNDSEPLEWRVLNPNINSTVCYAIPQTNLCPDNGLTFRGGESFSCNVKNNSIGRAFFQQCVVSDRDALLEPELMESGEVCLSNANFASVTNGTLYHFLCSLDVCQTVNDNCFLVTFVSSHIIIFAGPPSAPDIFYNGSFLCFSAYSHEEFPVETFTVEISDITGVSVDLAGTYRTRAPHCLSISSNPIPDLCLPFQISISATNAIGINSTTNRVVPENDDGTQSDILCDCYLEREQLNVNITNRTTESATLVLSCEQDNTTDSISYVLENQDTRQRDDITIACGGSLNIANLATATGYHILRKFGKIHCKVNNFTTAAAIIVPMVQPTTTAQPNNNRDKIIIGGTIGAIVAIVVVVGIVLSVTLAILLGRSKTKKSQNSDRLSMVATNHTSCTENS